MYGINVNPSQEIVNQSAIAPQSMAANAVANSGWVDAGLGAWIQAAIETGAISAGGILTATWLQATSSAGAGSKALSGGKFASTAFSVANTVSYVEDLPEQLDINNGFRWVRLVLTATVNTVLAAAQLNIGPAKNVTAVGPAS